MDDAKALWDVWQSLLEPFQSQFTRGGWVRFVQWVTGMVLANEEHTITQLLTASGLEHRWRVIEHFAEYGSWDRQAVERQLLRTVNERLPRRCGRYRTVALDDTKEHRTSADVWGTCTFHASTARCPNRAETVRAHNWVVLGDLVPGRPWTYLPMASRLYFRQKQLPLTETFQTKTQQAVELLRETDAESSRPILAAFDGAYAMSTVIEPCLHPLEGGRRIEIVTRLRRDARLYAAPAPRTTSPRAGRPRKWGRRLPAPQNHTQWSARWRKGKAYLYGRVRKFRFKYLECFWSVSGPQQLMHAFVFEMEGYKTPWYTITSARDLSAAQVGAVFGARFRQEDGFRDQKQRLGMEECRAWTKEPVLRTFQVQVIAQALLRLLQFQLDRGRNHHRWWSPPPWNPFKRHPSLLDLRRLLWKHRERFSHFLLRLEKFAKPPQAHCPRGQPTAQAA